MKKLANFLARHNAGREEAERVIYVHQVTPELLNQWMATWQAKTYWSKAKRRDNAIAFFDVALEQELDQGDHREGPRQSGAQDG
jgi:hypothetical protein